MVVKITGCILVFLSCMLFGNSFKLYTKKRIETLENLLYCMQVFEKEIRFSMSDIICASKQMLKVAEGDNAFIIKSFLDSASKSDGEALSSVWQKNIETNSSCFCYDKHDIDILLRFGTILGSADVEAQLKNIDVLCEGIRENINLINGKKVKNDEVFTKLGLYVGALIIVFLI